ncbi:hypothetical protein L1049_007100 [Liquidambar formosana]|uniref:SMP-30/Gluconolactonase/LRE-like region domain-containing protein n=1 Tax=Liquidambar formosana TaxID=63359 RepID=A0AAP0WV08_LIQFO
MSFVAIKASLISITTIFLIHVGPTLASKPHHITFRSHNLYPEAVAWDPSAQHFLLGSLHQRSIAAVSDAGVVETLISDPSLPPNSTILGIAVDSLHSRLVVVVHTFEPLPPFNALASYDLRSRSRLFLAELDSEISGERQIANDVTVDFKGNAYVTNSAGNFIWKVNMQGEPSIFSRSPAFTAYPVDRDAPYSFCGLNGIAYVSKGYFLVVQTNTGKMFKVDGEDGTARLVILPEDLTLADGIAVRRDGVVVVVSQHKAWFLRSDDSWGQGVVYDKTALDIEGFSTSVTVGGEDRVYVLYGHVLEGMMGNGEREMFRIEEIRADSESGEENVWVFVLVGLGLAYFLFWRFQMAQLAKNMNKKRA